MIPLKIAGVLPPHRHSREGTSPRTTIRGGNPSSATADSRVTSAEPTPIFIPRCADGKPAWMIPLKIAIVPPPHRHSREGTSPRTTIRGGNPSSTISHAMKKGSGKPVVGATLVVARPRRQPIFIPLCGLHKAMVIPKAAKRSKESKVLTVLDTASTFPI